MITLPKPPSASLSVACMRKMSCLPFAFYFLSGKLLKNVDAKERICQVSESRNAVLEVQNKQLIEELETLKDICSPKTD